VRQPGNDIAYSGEEALSVAGYIGRPPPQPETVSALQDLVRAIKSVSRAARHSGTGRSTGYRIISKTNQRQTCAESSFLE